MRYVAEMMLLLAIIHLGDGIQAVLNGMYQNSLLLVIALRGNIKNIFTT